jgi:mannan endo-1,4-beta-mannosidase
MSKKVKGRKRNVGIPLAVIILLLVFSCLFFYSLYSRYTRNQFKNLATLPPLAGKVAEPKKGAYLGVSLYDQNIDRLIALEKKVNKQFAIVGVYQSWEGTNTSFNSEWAENVEDQGSIPLITWEPWVPVTGYDRSENKVNQTKYRLTNITQGKFDPYIKQYADDVRDYRLPVMIRFAHEMNGNWYPWGSTFNKPKEYIAAWRHVHDIFARVGATNVTWVWSPNAIYTDPHVPYANKTDAFYPGDTYVDWVGLSAFNWAGQYKENIWVTPDQLFSPTVADLAKFKKPLIIAETASADGLSPVSKANWIKELALYMKDNEEIKGVIWFNTTDNGINWNITSTEASKNAFTTAFDNYFIQNFSR